MAQGTTCDDPTVLPGNVSPKLAAIQCFALSPQQRSAKVRHAICRCAGLRAASALCRTQVQQIRALSRQVLYCPAYCL